MTVSQAFSIFDDIELTVLKSSGQLFCRMSPNWGVSDVFLMIRIGLWAMGFEEEDH